MYCESGLNLSQKIDLEPLLLPLLQWSSYVSGFLIWRGGKEVFGLLKSISLLHEGEEVELLLGEIVKGKLIVVSYDEAIRWVGLWMAWLSIVFKFAVEPTDGKLEGKDIAYLSKFHVRFLIFYIGSLEVFISLLIIKQTEMVFELSQLNHEVDPILFLIFLGIWAIALKVVCKVFA